MTSEEFRWVQANALELLRIDVERYFPVSLVEQTVSPVVHSNDLRVSFELLNKRFGENVVLSLLELKHVDVG